MTLAKQKNILCGKLRVASAKRNYPLIKELIIQIELVQLRRNSIVEQNQILN